MKTRAALAALLALLTLPAQAQNGISLRVGYYGGVRFDGTAPTPRVKLEGLSIGMDWEVYRLPAGTATIRISPTVVFGGATREGNDQDATIVRVLATGKVPVPASPMYAIFGAGYATSARRGTTNFDTKAGFVTQWGLGTTVKLPQSPVRPFVEISYHSGRKPYTGWSAEVGIRF